MQVCKSQMIKLVQKLGEKIQTKDCIILLHLTAWNYIVHSTKNCLIIYVFIQVCGVDISSHV